MISPEKIKVSRRQILLTGTPIFDEVMRQAEVAWRFQGEPRSNPYVLGMPSDQHTFRDRTGRFVQPKQARIEEAWHLAGVALELGFDDFPRVLEPAYTGATFHEMITEEN